MTPTPDEEYYWRWPEYKFDIPIGEQGPTEAIRRRGIELIKYLPGSRDRIREIERGLVSLSADPRFVHLGGDPDCPWEMYCRPALKKALSGFYMVLNEEYGKEVLPIVSAYRRRGTHVVGADPSGVLDAGDEKGHWKGLSVDINRVVTDKWFGGADSILDGILARSEVGLWRPYYPRRYEERNHLTLR